MIDYDQTPGARTPLAASNVGRQDDVGDGSLSTCDSVDDERVIATHLEN